MANYETGDNSWNDRLPKLLKIPAIKANFNDRLPILLFSFLFLLAGVKIPVYDFSRDNDPGMDLKGLKEKAKIQLETLEETEIISHGEAQELKETVEKITNSADRNNPSRTFEAFDQLYEKIKHEGTKAAQEAMKNMQELEGLQNHVEKLQNTDPADTARLKSALSALKNAFNSSQTSETMAEEVRNSIEKGLNSVNRDGSPSAEEIKKAAEELKDYIKRETERMSEMMKKLHSARVIDSKTFEKMLRDGKIKREPGQMSNSEEVYIVSDSENGQKDKTGQYSTINDDNSTISQKGRAGSGKDGSGNAEGILQGQGGVPTRGGVSAPVNLNRKSSQHNVKFKNENLPDPGETSLDDSVVIGIGITAPQVETQMPPSGNDGAMNLQNPDRSSGKSDLILPRHRSIVKNYFKRNDP
ncbi:MAG: hypothetical protein Kow0029_10120 [Candidatus Rifleibacteriota bacterium]